MDGGQRNRGESSLDAPERPEARNSARRTTRASPSWGGFAVWSLIGLLLAYAILAIASVGLLLLPAGLGAAFLAGRDAQRREASPTELLGLLLGSGAACLWVAYANRDYDPCIGTAVSAVRVAGSAGCGGRDPLPWLVVGVVLGAIGVTAFLVARRVTAAPANGPQGPSS